jgi:ATP-dependent helicase/nuclease subunit A
VTLIDEPARQVIRERLRTTLFVEAGAGTGKTHSLVERIVGLVSAGLPASGMQGIAAITFTENAAAELRNRVRAALQKAADAVPATEASARCATALGGLDDASLSTLHGFASRLLADHALAAGLPLGFTVQDDVRAGLGRDRWWDTVVDRALADPYLQQVWRTALGLGLAPGSLRKIADRLHAEWDLLLTDDSSVPPPVPAWDMDAVLTPLREAVHRYSGQGPDGDPLTLYLEQTLPPLLAELDAEPDDLGRATVLLSEGGIKTTKGNATKWQKHGTLKAGPQELLVAASEAWSAQVEAVRAAVLQHLVRWLRSSVLADASRRRREGRLHFHDLLVLARVLLAEDEEVREQLHDRWPILLVDEFQDTDPLQVEIVHLLAADTKPDRWQDCGDVRGRLFFVGDPKQSIYRFRRADVQLYSTVRDQVSERPALTQNFRSRPLILEVVNASLRELMDGKPDQVPYTDLAAARTGPAEEDPGPDVLLLGGSLSADIEAVRQLEAEHLAATCRRVVEQGWKVRVDEEEGTRPAKFQDIAVLVPTRTSLSKLERELQAADVPYRIESRSLVWDTDIVRELLAILEAVADPSDAVAVVTALRSAAFGCSDDDLRTWRTTGGSWDPRRSEQGEGPVGAAMDRLRQYYERRWWLPVNHLIDDLMRAQRMVELTTGLRRPRDHWRRLRFVADQSRAYLDGGGSSLTGFVRWAREQAERGADAVETVVDEPDDDAVRILTIHSAKGLQFPVTVVSGINVDDALRADVLWHGDELQVKVKDFKTPGWDAAHTAERSMQEAESVRLLYVAMTRAEDHLVVSLHHKEKTKRNHASRLFAQLPELMALGVHYENGATRVKRAVVMDAPPPAVDLAARDAFAENRDALLARVRRAVPVTASSLSGDDDGEPVDELARTVDIPQQAEQPVVLRAPVTGGATLGSAVHRVLELVHFGAGEPQVRVVAEAVTAELECPELLVETLRRVMTALHCDLLRTAGRDLWKEVPVSAPVGDRFVEGYIDLVLRTLDGLVVVDYKTDSARTDAEIDAKVEHYGPQLRAYAQALQAATGLAVTRAVLLFIGSSRATERTVRMEPGHT